MRIYDYLALSKEEQWETLWDDAVYVASFRSIDCCFQLYAMDRFFIELELCPQQGSILNMGVFVHGKKMDKYTDTVYQDILGFL
ncbi:MULTISPECIES: hypothetical protein [Flavobacteriaceae]|jgi:hypothetical protein|uniref:Uncharacterized protein n=1 Tax=Flagellimonas sp. MMG031 TaxID=3158549 RepID=A0AAU7MSY5_9FLAO|nr:MULTISPECIES: hypothetical protein [unclassified Allomuricauda]MBO6828859.1 hypothetical protein [Allomuricauda sp.]NYJ28664.1 hypothetical protein [Muricauda sp. ARW1Y1]